MSTNKTPNLGMHDPIGTDQFKRDEIYENFRTLDAQFGGDPIAINIIQGTQIINAVKQSMATFDGMKGLTKVNHAGRQGGFGSQGAWDANLVIDTANYKFGTSSGKVDNSAGTGIKQSTNSQKMYLSGKRVLLGLWAKAVSGTPAIRFRINGRDSSGTLVTGDALVDKAIDSTWKFHWVKFDFSAKTDAYWELAVGVTTYGTANDVVNFDGVVVHELTSIKYSYAHTQSEAEKDFGGYVEAMQPVFNPYIIAPGKNLLPPFHEWTLHTNHVMISPYELNEPNADGTSKASTVTIDALENTTYTVSVEQNTGNRLVMDFQDKNGASLSTPNYYNGGTFTTPAGTVKITVRWYSVSLSGSLTLKNPMLNAGSSALPFEAQNKTYKFWEIKNGLRSTPDGTSTDELNGNEVLRKQWYAVLDGSLPWLWSADASGYKRVALDYDDAQMPRAVIDSETVIKYDGKVLQRVTDIVAATSADQVEQRTADQIYITIADTDSGLPEAYAGGDYTTDGVVATATQLIKAYFNGWKYVYNGTSGTAIWRSIGDNTTTSRDPVYVSTVVAPGYTTPYTIQYQLATPVVEAVESEGDVFLFEGANQLTMGAGVIVREAANPKNHSGANTFINYNGMETASRSPLSFRASTIFGIYKNNVEDNWHLEVKTNGDAYGNQWAYIPDGRFNETAAYSATYFPLDMHKLGFAPDAIIGKYEGNLSEVVNQHTKEIVEHSKRISVVENEYARKQQGQWIAPALLNGTSNYGGDFERSGYMKNEFGFVVFKGLINVPSLGTFMYLPVGYRPSKIIIIHAIGYNGSTFVDCRVDISPTGAVKIESGVGAASNWMSLSDFTPFLAEQ